MSVLNRILFIAPLPPPVDGQSKASAQVLTALQANSNEVIVVNSNRRSLSRSVISQIIRVLEILPILIKVAIGRFRAQTVYISLSESLLGNVKDILTYSILIGKLDRITVHMLGGSGMDAILNDRSFLSRINGLFMKRMNGVIVEGKRGYKVFSRYFTEDRIHVVPNFVDDYLRVDENEIRRKFDGLEQLQVLYLSNMLTGKGYLDLFKGFISLPASAKLRIKLKFVGGFPEPYERESFLRLIATEPNVEYLGNFIDGEDKRALYMRSHVFCLPTYYPYEGQPISILEAYATGCAVLTTNHGGISDIFVDNHNGYLVLPRDPGSVGAGLLKALNDIGALRQMAVRNAQEADVRYRSDSFRERVIQIINKQVQRS